MTWAYPLFAFILDLAIGDPRWIPHPVTVIGRGISWSERILRDIFRDSTEKTAGVILVTVIVLPPAAGAFVISRFLFSFSGTLTMIIAMFLFIYLASTTLALRGLVSSAHLVMKAVDRKDMADARRQLAMIVGRDTDNLEKDAVLRATIETVAENLSDGFVAPLLYLVIGGLPLAFAYKAINTLDSMIGYKNKKYIRFGWAAARLDDLANYVPARLTGLAIAAAGCIYFAFADRSGLRRARNSLRIMCRDGRNHTSPNSGVPEAAMAGVLDVRLGGPSTYDGLVVEKPFIGDGETADYRMAATQTLGIAVVASSLAVVLSTGVLWALRNSQ
jgi:adenosylcobinamide-phosphate synthase